jgi:hypothetical protein
VSKLDDLKRLRAARLERISSSAAEPRNKGGDHVNTSRRHKHEMAENENENENENDHELGIKSGPSAAGRGPEIEKGIIGATNSRRPFRKPLAKDAAATISRQKPWEKETMSRATWYRRQAEQRDKGQ